MIHAAQVHQLVDEHVFADVWWHEEEPPVERDMTVAAAGSPAGPLIADADARQRGPEPVCDRKRAQARGKLGLRPASQQPTLLRRGARAQDEPRPLPCDPVQIPLEKRVGVASRSAARNGDADPPVGIHAKQVPAGSPLADVVRLSGRRGARRASWGVAKRQTELQSAPPG